MYRPFQLHRHFTAYQKCCVVTLIVYEAQSQEGMLHFLFFGNMYSLSAALASSCLWRIVRAHYYRSKLTRVVSEQDFIHQRDCLMKSRIQSGILGVGNKKDILPARHSSLKENGSFDN